MKILHISSLSGNKSAGLTYSVPRQIAAQSKYSKIFWVNLCTPKLNRDDFGHANIYDKFNIKNLKPPFKNPDLVVFQGVYYLKFCKIAYTLRQMNIPYIIIPRGSLTESAQNIKFLKKKLGNIISFNYFIKKAIAIQYLTNEEYRTSGDKWNTNNIIIPNGVELKQSVKKWDDNPSLRGIFIGRKDIYHKGLDILIETCIQLRQDLIKHNCTIYLYGPDRGKSRSFLRHKVQVNQLENIVFLKDGIYDEAKERILLDSDFFILTSRFEGHPTGLLEALSYGLPCLVTTGSNMAEEIKKYDAGWIASNDKQSLGNAFITLLNERIKLKEKGKRALELSKQYSWDVIAKKTCLEYNKLLDKYRINF